MNNKNKSEKSIYIDLTHMQVEIPTTHIIVVLLRKIISKQHAEVSLIKLV